MEDIDSIKSRLLSKTIIDPITGCWNWMGGIRSCGYGGIKIANKTYLTHRISYQVHIGDIADGMFVCHKCDNPRCINPDHLFLGTPRDNVVDAICKGRIAPIVSTKGRFKPGRRAHNRLLPDDKVIQIKKMINDGLKVCEIANKANVNRSVVADIKRGQAYADVK